MYVTYQSESPYITTVNHVYTFNVSAHVCLCVSAVTYIVLKSGYGYFLLCSGGGVNRESDGPV